MDSEDLIVLRSEAAFAPPAAQPAAGSSKRLLGVLAMSALFSVAVLMWLHIIADIKTNPILSVQKTSPIPSVQKINPIPTVQSVSIQAQTPPPGVKIARSFEIMAAADPTERTQEAPAEPEFLRPKLLAWAASNNAYVPTEIAEPPKVAPAKDAEAKTSAAQDREREQEALADKRWEERHARRLAAARKPVQRAQPQLQPAQQQAQKPQQMQQQPQKPAPTASATPLLVPQASDSWRGGG
jgi:hypothetical protein